MNDSVPSPVVLVVEDEWLVREEISEEFRKAGWRVIEANTGEVGCRLAENQNLIDAVVTDIQLAGRTNGWDVAEAFRANHPGIPVIYASGNATERSRMVSDSVFFTKPCAAAELLETCRRLHRLAHQQA